MRRRCKFWPKVPGPITPALESQRNLWPSKFIIVNDGIGKPCILYIRYRIHRL